MSIGTRRTLSAVLVVIGLGTGMLLVGAAQSAAQGTTVAELQAASTSSQGCGEALPGPTRQRGLAYVTGISIGDFTGGGPGGAVEILGMTHEVEVPYSGPGQPTGSAIRGPFTITKTVDRSSPLFQQAVVTNEGIPDARFEFVDASGLNDYTVELENALVIKVSSRMVKRCQGGFTHLEDVSFAYQRITYTHEPTRISFQDDVLTPADGVAEADG